MSVPNQIPESNYVGNGTTTTFAANFEYASDSDVFVTVNGIAPEIGQATFANGVFTFITAPANGTAVRVYRSTPVERDTEYDNHDNVFRPRVVNIDFDRIWFVLQEYLMNLGITNQVIAKEISDRILADQQIMQHIATQISNVTTDYIARDLELKDDYIQRDQINRNALELQISATNNALSTEANERKSNDDSIITDYILRDETLRNYIDQTLGALLDLPDFQGIEAKFVRDASGKSQQEINDAITTAMTFTFKVYDTPDAGVDSVTGVGNGAYYNVRSTEDDSYLIEYQNVGGSAVATGKSYLSSLGVQQQEKPASTIKDASGKDQQQINNLNRLIEVSPEHFGYVSGDATQAFKDAALYAKENNVPFVAKNPNGYLITQTVYFYTDTDISKVIMPADGVYRYLVLDTLNTPTEITSGLSGLTEFSKVITGFPVGSTGKYVKIESPDVLTERNNAPSNIPYTKSTAFKILSSSGDISPSLDMSFTGTYTAKIYPPESKIDFRLGSFETVGSGENLNGIIIERNSVDVYINTASSQTQFRTIVNLRGCDINFYSPVLNNADFAGYGYGISIGLCCDINIYSMQSGRCRAGLDGRHGANVTVYNSRLERAGTHWGNNYKFIDCDIERVLYSGKDLSVQGGFVKEAVQMRHDIAMCIGTLDIKNVATDCSTVFIEPSAIVISDFFSTPRRFFDVVKIKNITFNKNPTVVFGHSTTNQFGADFIPPHTFDLSDFYASETQRLYLVQMNLANAVVSKKGVAKIANINLKDGGYCVPFSARTTVKFPATTGYAVTVRDVGKFFIQTDADTFTEYKAFNSHFIGANRFVSKTALGRIDLNGCKVDHDAAVATLGQWRINSNKALINCEYTSNFTEQVSTADGIVEYAVGCVAKVGVTGFKPVPYYVDPALYQTPTA